jgi:RNA polymerase sigma-70 factor (ECF subfamily)
LDSDEQVERGVRGDADALEALLRQVEPDLRAGLSIHPIWRRSFELDDVLQVSYLEAFLRIGALELRTLVGFRAWLKRITQRNLSDAIRALERDKRPAVRRRLTRGGAGESARTLFAKVAGDHASASSLAVEAEVMALLREAIQRLPASYRQVIEQLDLAERGVSEVATELGRSPGAVHMLHSRALDRLRELLSE